MLRDGRIVSVHPGTAGAYQAVSPELAARLAAAGQAYERQTGKAPRYGELSRGEDVQKVYRDKYEAGTGGIAAKPGHSQHQKGAAGDLPDSDFRKWLYAGNAKQFGLHFPVKGDTPHVQADPTYKGQLATSAAASAGGTALNPPANPGQTGPVDADTRRRAFLATIARGEAPKGAYDYIIGGGKAKDLADHPRTMGSAGKYGSSDAAGQYQFLSSTWDEQAKKYGYKDFSAGTQDLAAWNYAKDTYAQKSGRNLETDLASNDPAVLNGISKTLGQTWTSLPGGSQPNSNWAGKDFASVYNENIKANTAVPSAADPNVPLDPTPNVGSGASDYPAPTPNVNSADDGPSVGASFSPSDTPTEVASTLGKNQFGSGFGEALAGIGSAFGAGGGASKTTSTPSSTTVPAANLPTPPGPVSMVDPRMAEMHRQQLAMAIQRLNSGKLY